MQMNVPCGSF